MGLAPSKGCWQPASEIIGLNALQKAHRPRWARHSIRVYREAWSRLVDNRAEGVHARAAAVPVWRSAERLRVRVGRSPRGSGRPMLWRLRQSAESWWRERESAIDTREEITAGMVGLTRSAMTVAVGASSWSNSTRPGAMGANPQGFFVSRFRGDWAITDEQTGGPAFAIPLRTSESWRPSVAG